MQVETPLARDGCLILAVWTPSSSSFLLLFASFFPSSPPSAACPTRQHDYSSCNSILFRTPFLAVCYIQWRRGHTLPGGKENRRGLVRRRLRRFAYSPCARLNAPLAYYGLGKTTGTNMLTNQPIAIKFVRALLQFTQPVAHSGVLSRNHGSPMPRN